MKAGKARMWKRDEMVPAAQGKMAHWLNQAWTLRAFEGFQIIQAVKFYEFTRVNSNADQLQMIAGA